MQRIYLDYAASAPVLPEVLDEMLPFFCVNYFDNSYISSNKNIIETIILF